MRRASARKKWRQKTELHEHAAQLALALRAGLANIQTGSSFFLELASERDDEKRGTDIFLHRGSRSVRIDVTEGGRKTIIDKINRAAGNTRRGSYRVLIVPFDRESVISIAADPCFPRAYEAFLAQREPVFNPQKERMFELVALTQACPEHGNSCELKTKLLKLSDYLNSYLRSFRMPRIATTPLPLR
ncbi:hypothetical protein A2797_01625 [candidate division WWE3 bacterium RIFCSPHIGHO2_01_FULL_48_15]|uniref:Uncharacterized protein n=1 Tax=candidate division WWE3 bacterium RIFCSPHIGHO2_01_FULL_48_15 TaxID=1802619 RepID=A0A1F4VCA3_UNCKA|nr:MAG: hypothetical protein A2797_01625 [candidate division WWE3 bacterium RIFCSPHIGHO2_01_FULL_48_15]